METPLMPPPFQEIAALFLITNVPQLGLLLGPAISWGKRGIWGGGVILEIKWCHPGELHQDSRVVDPSWARGTQPRIGGLVELPPSSRSEMKESKHAPPPPEV